MTPRATTTKGPTLVAAPFMAADSGDLIQLLTARQQAQLAAIGEPLNVPRGHVFYREGTPAQHLFFCQEGAVKSYKDMPSGTQRVRAFLFAGDIFGLAESGRYTNSAKALTKVVGHRIPMVELTEMLKRDAVLEFQFLGKVIHALRQAQRQAVMMGRRDAAGRLAMFLVMMRRRFPGSPLLPLPMSRTDIAGYLGHSLEATSRAASRLKKQGIIAVDRNQVRILDSLALERIAANV